jgi:hypothetical protein
VVTYSINTYFEDKARKRGWDWNKVSAMERDREENELMTSYRFHKDQMEMMSGVEVA